jgi:hypothetical protein
MHMPTLRKVKIVLVVVILLFYYGCNFINGIISEGNSPQPKPTPHAKHK